VGKRIITAEGDLITLRTISPATQRAYVAHDIWWAAEESRRIGVLVATKTTGRNLTTGGVVDKRS
jgi:hypothetical protein